MLTHFNTPYKARHVKLYKYKFHGNFGHVYQRLNSKSVAASFFAPSEANTDARIETRVLGFVLGEGALDLNLNVIAILSDAAIFNLL